ncbi:MAG TPA: hypothetical protein VIX59_19755 [Candidatus Binataceae bacterium]
MTAEQITAIDRLVRQILVTAPQAGRAELHAWRQPREELGRLARRDYVRYLRKTLGYHELREVVATATKVWPKLNCAQLTAAPRQRFARMASERASKLGVSFQGRPYEGPEGLALRGFYIENEKTLLKRPLIYVNTAHHPGAVSTTFFHELSHHLTAAIVKTHHKPVHFFFDADYDTHLRDPGELAADVIVSLGGYPEKIARKIFSAPWNWGLVARAGRLTDEVFGKVLAHVQELYGLDFSSRIPPGQRLHYLTGMIHYAKLRWALLAEYDL